MSKYLDRLSEKADAKDAKSNALEAVKAQEQIKQHISKLSARKAELASFKEAALGAKPFRFSEVFQLVKEAEENEKELELAASLLATEFAD